MATEETIQRLKLECLNDPIKLDRLVRGFVTLSEADTQRQASIDANTPGPSRRSDPATSRRAGEDIRGRTGTIRRRVYEALLRAPEGLTDQQLHKSLGGVDSSIQTRRKELQDTGVVIDSGNRRATDSGNLVLSFGWSRAGASPVRTLHRAG